MKRRLRRRCGRWWVSERCECRSGTSDSGDFRIAKAGSDSDLRQEAESIKHLPDFLDDSVFEEVHVHAGGGDDLAGRRGAEIFCFVGSGKQEAVCDPLAIGNGIAYIQTDIRKCIQDLRVVIAEARDSRTDAAGETVMDDGLAIEPQVSFKIPDFIPGVGLAKGFKIFLARHLFLPRLPALRASGRRFSRRADASQRQE
jgi:hypothetical protein